MGLSLHVFVYPTTLQSAIQEGDFVPEENTQPGRTTSVRHLRHLKMDANRFPYVSVAAQECYDDSCQPRPDLTTAYGNALQSAKRTLWVVPNHTALIDGNLTPAFAWMFLTIPCYLTNPVKENYPLVHYPEETQNRSRPIIPPIRQTLVADLRLFITNIHSL
jgi:hypothetical protein